MQSAALHLHKDGVQLLAEADSRRNLDA